MRMRKTQKILWGFLALVSLAVCLLSALGSFLGKLGLSQYKLIFLIASFAWFIFATLWAKNHRA